MVDSGWVFTDGNPVPGNRWRDRQPSDWISSGNDDGVENGDQNCGIIPWQGTFNYSVAGCFERFPTICQSVECGSLGLECCDGGRCEYGLACEMGTCKSSCGLEGQACCSDSALAPCIAGLYCGGGTCKDCLTTPCKVLKEGKCVDHPYSYLKDKSGMWPQAYSICAAEGLRLLSVASDEEFDVVNLYLRQRPSTPKEVHFNNPLYVAENTQATRAYVAAAAKPRRTADYYYYDSSSYGPSPLSGYDAAPPYAYSSYENPPFSLTPEPATSPLQAPPFEQVMVAPAPALDYLSPPFSNPPPPFTSPPPPPYDEFNYGYQSQPATLISPFNGGYDAPPPVSSQGDGPDQGPVLPDPRQGLQYCLNRRNITLCDERDDDVEDIVCQTGTCGVKGAKCCSGSRCDLGLTCTENVCELKCGLWNQPCCTEGFKCFLGMGCYQGICEECQLGLQQQGDECTDNGLLRTNIKSTWAAVYQECLDRGLILAQLDQQNGTAITRAVRRTTVWVGGYQQDNTDSLAQGWVWLNGSEVETGWGKNQPNNNLGAILTPEYGYYTQTQGRYYNNAISAKMQQQSGLPHQTAYYYQVPYKNGDYPGVFSRLTFETQCLKNAWTPDQNKRALVSAACERKHYGLCQAVPCGVLGEQCCEGSFCYPGLACGSDDRCEYGCGLQDQACCTEQTGLELECLGELICQEDICKSCRPEDGMKIVDGKCQPAVGDVLLDMDGVGIDRMFLEQVPGYADPCLESKGCLASTEGFRWVLRFDLQVKNIGEGDIVVGNPPPCPTDFSNITQSSNFTFDTCNWEWSPKSILNVVLDRIDNKTREVVETVATNNVSLTLQDDVCFTNQPRYTFTDQGISRGCGDNFESNLRCFWVDVTNEIDNLDSVYRLKFIFNSEQSIKETNYDNNVAEIRFRMGDVRREPSVEFGYVPFGVCPFIDDQGLESPILNQFETQALIDDESIGTSSAKLQPKSGAKDSTRRLNQLLTNVNHVGIYTPEIRQMVANEMGELLSPCPRNAHVPAGCVTPSWVKD